MKLEEIKIVDLDIDKTRPSNKASGLRHMFLALSSSPPREWVDIFKNERSFPRHTMWRDAWIEGNYIVVDCVPEEMQQYHLRDLKEDVSNANSKYKDHLVRVDAQNERKMKDAEEERNRLAELKKELDFD